jgi:hypothetical protein
MTGAVFACLYLPGGPGPRGRAEQWGDSPGSTRTGTSGSSWPRVWSALCRLAPSLSQVPEALRCEGLFREALACEDRGLLEESASLCFEGAVLWPGDPLWPRGWDRLATGPGSSSAPPVCWRRGPRLAGEGPWGAVVGSRNPGPLGVEGARACALALASEGAILATGGAAGVDALALDTAALGPSPRAVILHPRGLDTPEALAAQDRWPWAVHLSACSRGAGFATGEAMRRNLLIYGAGDAVFVVGPQWQEGGTWHGASSALRRRLGPVGVWEGAGDPRAERALCTLGAWRTGDGEGLVPPGEVLALGRSLALGVPGSFTGGLGSASGVQGSLFDSFDSLLCRSSLPEQVQEVRAPYGRVGCSRVSPWPWWQAPT